MKTAMAVTRKRGSGALAEKLPAAPLDQPMAEYARVLAHAVETFGSRTRANDWLSRPHRLFEGRTPLQVLTLDPAAVDEELFRIDHGTFV